MNSNIQFQSMTGFGAAQNEIMSIEIRSVNHRYFDVFFRAPGYLNKLEVELKKRLKEFFSRGRFEISISVNAEKISELAVNDELVSGIVRAFEHIKDKYSISGDISLELLSGYKDILISDNVEFEDEQVFDVFDDAVKRLTDMRIAEGKNIKDKLDEMLGNVRTAVNMISDKSAGISEKLRERYLAKMDDLIKRNIADESRLIQEASVIAERSDISEEIARLESHIKQFSEIMGSGGPVGRKLDFLLQEFFREANTIAAKTSELKVVSIVVDLKNEIEKLREQVQNIQ